MRLSVNSTRMELLKLRRRHSIAVRGHRLLKDKQDELMRCFLQAIEKQRQIIADQKKFLLNNLITGTIRLPEFIKQKTNGQA